MKRSKALRSLSRDHHKALSVALDLRRARDVGQASARFLEFWPDGALHFRIEEEVLLPQWERFGTVNAEAVTRLTAEHRTLRAAALEVSAGTASLSSLRDLGAKLAAHVRFEERELFPMIEADLGEQQLETLARVVAKAEANR